MADVVFVGESMFRCRFCSGLVLLIAAWVLFCGCETEEQPTTGKPATAPVPPGSRLPKLSGVTRMEARFFNNVLGREVSFNIPQEHWDEIYRSLLPARKDNSPAKWESVGQIDIVKNNGAKCKVWLFLTGQGDGAFAAGATFESRVYFRGGNSRNLVGALEEAYADSKKKDGQEKK